MFDELSNKYPKLKLLMQCLKEGFQTSIRNIVANEVEEKGIRESHIIIKERENLSKIKKQYADKQLKIEEQDDIIDRKDNKIAQLIEENKNLQNILEKHRVIGMKIQDENDDL